MNDIIIVEPNLREKILTVLRNGNNRGFKRYEISNMLMDDYPSFVNAKVTTMKKSGELEYIQKKYYLKGTRVKKRKKHINSLREKIARFLATAPEGGYTPNKITTHFEDEYSSASTRSAFGRMMSLGQIDQKNGKYFLVEN